MNCSDVQNNIKLYLSGDINPNDLQVLRAHVDSCTNCQVSMKKANSFMKWLGDSLPEALRAEKIMSQIDSRPRRRRLLTFASIAAAALIVIALFILNPQQKKSETFETALPNGGYLKAAANTVISKLDDRTFRLDKGKISVQLKQKQEKLAIKTASETVEILDASSDDTAAFDISIEENSDFSMNNKILVIAILSGLLQITNSQGTIYALKGDLVSIQDGKQMDRETTQEVKPATKIWDVDLKSTSYGSGAVADIDNDGKLEIVFGTYFNDRHLYAVNAEDGTVLWKKKSEKGPFDASVAIIDIDKDGKLEVFTGDSSTGTLFCLNGKDGTEKWTIKLPNSTDSPPAIADIDNDGVLEIVVGSMWKHNGKGNVSVYRADNQKLVWSKEVKGCVQSAPCLVDLNGDKVIDVVVASWRGDNAVHAFSGKDGERLWKFDTMDGEDKSHLGSYHGVAAGPLEKDGPIHLVVGTCHKKNGTFYVIDAKGKEVWKKELNEYLFAPPYIVDMDNDEKSEIIVCGTNIHVFSTDQKEKWSVKGQSMRGPVFVDIDGDKDLDLVIGTSNNILAFDGKKGDELWKYDAKIGKHHFEKIGSAPLVADFDNDGFLDVFFVIGKGTYGGGDKGKDNYGKAIAIRGGKGKGTGWLTFQNNLRRTGTIN